MGSVRLVVALAFCLGAGLPITARQVPPNACAALAADEPIVAVGIFSDMRSTEEHTYGTTVRLWRAGDCAFGLFELAQGLTGDTPIGELQAATYNPTTGALSFAAKLTIGVFSRAGSTMYEPTQDLFRFDGRIDRTALVGTLVHANQAVLNVAPDRRAIQLLAVPRDGTATIETTTYGAWRERWQPVLARRGPKW